MSKISNELLNHSLRNGFIPQPNKKTKSASDKVRFAAFLEMVNLGFQTEPKELEGFTELYLTRILNEMRSVIGADRNMTPIYPGFPKQVEELSTSTLLIEQILHYWSHGTLIPNYPSVIREGLPLTDVIADCRVLQVVSAAKFARLTIKEIVSNPVAMSESNITLLKGCVELQHPDLDSVTEIVGIARNSENIHRFLNIVNNIGCFSKEELAEAVLPVCKNLDEVLRVVLTLFTSSAAEHLDEKYVSTINHLTDRNARSIRMKNISRPVRRSILKNGSRCSQKFSADKLVARQQLWRIVMRAVHPYDFKLTSSERRFADIIHSNIEYKTLNSLVEQAIENKNVALAVELLEENAPGNLLRRIVSLLRLVTSNTEVDILVNALHRVGSRSTLTTIISAYNGVLAANMNTARVVRVAGSHNQMLNRDFEPVDEAHICMLTDALKSVIVEKLNVSDAPTSPVGIVSSTPVPLVKRDTATSDSVIDRGSSLLIPDSGSVLRIFGHWNNNMKSQGYMDVAAVVLDENFTKLSVCTWDSWKNSRDWATYSGDKLVHPGDSAAEYIDVKLDTLKKNHPSSRYVVMTLQSWSGFPIGEVDFIGGAMFRSNGTKGEVFDPRSVLTAFKPTTSSLQSVLFAVDLVSSRMIWLDSSNGSITQGKSSSSDNSISEVVRDEIGRPRLTIGELAQLWAEAHKIETVDAPVERETILALI